MGCKPFYAVARAAFEDAPAADAVVRAQAQPTGEGIGAAELFPDAPGVAQFADQGAEDSAAAERSETAKGRSLCPKGSAGGRWQIMEDLLRTKKILGRAEWPVGASRSAR